jgi:ferredoxin
MLILELLPIAILVSVLLIGGPITLIVGIRAFNAWIGNIQVKPVATGLPADQGAPLGLLISWDNEAYDYKVVRVRLEYYEIFRGGRSLSTSFTFEDKQAKKRSFILPLKLIDTEFKMLTTFDNPSELKRSHVIIEVESTDGRTVRRKISKKNLILALQSMPVNAAKVEAEMLPAKEADAWSVHSRVFPWRKLVEKAVAAPKAKAPSAGGSAVAQVFDFIVTKVWIEPGCIVCDACENEAPEVFHVLPDTCVVRENAPLTNTASIVAAAEGCPVNVIKYDTAPKSA